MAKPLHQRFSRRERQIMDAVFSLGDVTVKDVVDEIGEPDAYDSVRVTMGILEKKGYLTHWQEEGRNVYVATIAQEKARRSAMQHLLETFFEGSSSQAILAFLDMSGRSLSEEELDEITALIEGGSRGARGTGEDDDDEDDDDEDDDDDGEG